MGVYRRFGVESVLFSLQQQILTISPYSSVEDCMLNGFGIAQSEFVLLPCTFLPFMTYYLTRHGPQRKQAPNGLSVVLRVSIFARTYSPSRCLAKKRMIHRQIGTPPRKHSSIFKNKENRLKMWNIRFRTGFNWLRK